MENGHSLLHEKNHLQILIFNFKHNHNNKQEEFQVLQKNLEVKKN